MPEMTAYEMTAWVLECGCEPEIEHCAQCDERRAVRTTLRLAERMSKFADEIMEPLLCRQPAYGAPGYAHCAACCYGKGYIVTCDEDQVLVDAAKALNRAAAILRPDSPGAG